MIMKNLFRKRKNKNIQDWEYKLLKAIIEKLSPKYYFLRKQINSDFILDSVPNELLGNGWKRTICKQDLYNTLRNNTINYKLVGIMAFDMVSSSFKNIELDLFEGILIGYKIDDYNNNYLFDLEKIELKNLKELYYENNDKCELLKIIGDVSNIFLSKLDIDDTFKIEIEECTFYVIKDFKDGNYLSVNTIGQIFGMIHDPYEIEKLFENVEDFFKALESGKFDISNYIYKKNDIKLFCLSQ